MIPFASPDLFFHKIERDPLDLSDEFWFVFKDSQLLVEESSFEPHQSIRPHLERIVYMGKFQNLHIYAAEASCLAEAPLNSLWVDFKALYEKMDPGFFALGGRASALLFWHRMHQFCGQCGSKTAEKKTERARECPSCSGLHFPKISPVIMALVHKGDEILLARGSHFPEGMYSVLAGFVDPSETLEQCVKREVLEEVGLQVENIQYFGSQPWPFPSSLMIGFTCSWESGEIVKDPLEIEDARWFTKDNLPSLPPKMSLSRILIEHFLNRS